MSHVHSVMHFPNKIDNIYENYSMTLKDTLPANTAG